MFYADFNQSYYLASEDLRHKLFLCLYGSAVWIIFKTHFCLMEERNTGLKGNEKIMLELIKY